MKYEGTKRRILITGGAGFIGHHLAKYLANDESNYIVLVDNHSRGQFDADMAWLVRSHNIELIPIDLAIPGNLDKLGEGYDEVYHLAAIIGVKNVLNRPDNVLHVNIGATLLLLDWFVRGGGKKLVFSSTSEVYAWTQHFYPLPIPTPETVPLALTDLSNRRSSYAGSKILGELAVTQICGINEKPFVIVRYHNVYGPRMGYEHVIPELYYRALSGQDPLVVYSAHHRRAFCYVSDAVKATVLAMRLHAANGHTFNIGNDLEEVTVRELAEGILNKAKIRTDIREEESENDPIVRRCPDISNARKVLGYEPSVTLDQGLGHTLAWYNLMHKASHGDPRVQRYDEDRNTASI